LEYESLILIFFGYTIITKESIPDAAHFLNTAKIYPNRQSEAGERSPDFYYLGTALRSLSSINQPAAGTSFFKLVQNFPKLCCQIPSPGFHTASTCTP